jgi:glycosyltransferase involved in cell wall biosynthesis
VTGQIKATFLTPSGIDCSFWRLRDRKPRSQIVLSVGALIPIKGHDVLIEAFSRVRSTFPSLRLTIVGDGKCRDSLEVLARRNNLAEKIDFAGHCARTKIRDLLSESIIFVMPSRAEGLPLAALEAMSCGVPIIASKVGGVPSIIEHQVSGLLVPPDCPKALADAIQKLLRNPDEAQMLALHAHETAQGFSLKRMAKTYHDMYFAVLKSASG